MVGSLESPGCKVKKTKRETVDRRAHRTLNLDAPLRAWIPAHFAIASCFKSSSAEELSDRARSFDAASV